MHPKRCALRSARALRGRCELPGGAARWRRRALVPACAAGADRAQRRRGRADLCARASLRAGGSNESGRGPDTGAFGLFAGGFGRGDSLRARCGLRHAAAGRQRRPRHALGRAYGAPRSHHPAGRGRDPAPLGPRGGNRPGLLRRCALRHRCRQGDRAWHRRRGAGRGGRGLAAGGAITGTRELTFAADRSDEDRTHGTANIIKATASRPQ